MCLQILLVPLWADKSLSPVKGEFIPAFEQIWEGRESFLCVCLLHLNCLQIKIIFKSRMYNIWVTYYGFKHSHMQRDHAAARHILELICQLWLKSAWRAEKLWVCLCFYIFYFILLFRAPLAAYGNSQARGPVRDVAASLCQPQQYQIPAVSATYTTAHGNAGSLTY